MKNIHVLPTDKPSRLVLDDTTQHLMLINKGEALWGNQNIYITNDEEIKEGDWFYVKTPNIYGGNVVARCLSFGKHCWSENILTATTDEKGYHPSHCVKIIMTKDQDLIKYGVQAIDDEFLEWFVKNPSCEWVEVESWKIDKEWDEKFTQFNPIYPHKTKYKIIIPKLEPKQETLEEFIRKESKSGNESVGIIKGAKWQQERMYSEEEVLVILDKFLTAMIKGEKTGLLEKWFKQFKKK